MEPKNNSQQENSKVFNVTKLISLLQRCLELYGDVPVLVSIRTPDKVHISNIVDFAYVSFGDKTGNFKDKEKVLVTKNSLDKIDTEKDDISLWVEVIPEVE